MVPPTTRKFDLLAHLTLIKYHNLPKKYINEIIKTIKRYIIAFDVEGKNSFHCKLNLIDFDEQLQKHIYRKQEEAISLVIGIDNTNEIYLVKISQSKQYSVSYRTC